MQRVGMMPCGRGEKRNRLARRGHARHASPSWHGRPPCKLMQALLGPTRATHACTPCNPHPRHTRIHGTAEDPSMHLPPPDEVISELPATVGEERKQRSSSRYIGVSWHKANSSWRVNLTEPQTKRSRHIGSYASEEDAARAYDCAAVEVHGPGAKRNFPGEAVSELHAGQRTRL